MFVQPAVENSVGAFELPARLTVSVPTFVPLPICSPLVAVAVPPSQLTVTEQELGINNTKRANEPAAGSAALLGDNVTLPDVSAVLVAAARVITPWNVVTDELAMSAVPDAKATCPVPSLESVTRWVLALVVPLPVAGVVT